MIRKKRSEHEKNLLFLRHRMHHLRKHINFLLVHPFSPNISKDLLLAAEQGLVLNNMTALVLRELLQSISKMQQVSMSIHSTEERLMSEKELHRIVSFIARVRNTNDYFIAGLEIFKQTIAKIEEGKTQRFYQ